VQLVALTRYAHLRKELKHIAAVNFL
jgi:hypothetical protein